MTLEYENIGKVDGDLVIADINKWQAELDGGIVDSIIYETLETVKDILVDYNDN